MQSRLKIGFAASEVAPFAKIGGLADVAAALPAHLQRLGHQVRVFLPFYSQIDVSGQDIHPVDFIQDVALEIGAQTHTFSARVTRLPGSDAELYLIDCPEMFHRSEIYTQDPDEIRRFTLFSRAVIECCQRMNWAPDVFHCNDWHTALIPFLLRTVYEWDAMFHNCKSLVTIHNIGYQGNVPAGAIDELGLRDYAHMLDQDELKAGRLSYLRTGLIYCDAVSTVSPTYAREIQTDEFGMGLQELLRARRGNLVGILNGVDYDTWSPDRDAYIPHRYSRQRLEGKGKNKRYLMESLQITGNPGSPLLGIVSRLAHQKGFDLGFDVLPDLLAKTDLCLVVLGRGEARYEEFFEGLQRRFPGRAVYHRGYHDELAHVIEAGCDMLLMPSRYEPCGLNQLFSLKYGTIPIVRKTGGLADSVQQFDPQTERGTGFVFEHFTPDGLRWALRSAISLYRDKTTWRRLMKNAMRQDFSWTVQAKRYVELYNWMLQRKSDS